ncbi:MAG: ankyrin repeat domain-containing protein [Ignavibacteria bacterium]|nr:ankyrin repeat domain-containing protein [Ignavibacteria bacterium]
MSTTTTPVVVDSQASTEIFIEAVRANDVEKVRQMLAADPALANVRSESGDSAILLSLYHGCHAIANELLATGARLSVFEAAAIGNLDRVKEHLSIDPRLLNAVSHDGWTAVHLSAFFGQTEVVQYLATIGADLHAISKNGFGAMPLHSAVTGKRLEVAQFLLEQGVDVNARQTTLGYTPLHYAAVSGMQSAAKKLIEFGAEVHLKSVDGKTPLDLATEKNHAEVIQILEPLVGSERKS